MALLSKDAILAVDDLTFEEVEVEEWGGTVRIRCHTGGERDAFEQSLMDAKGKAKNMADIRARFIAPVLVDEDGKRLFTNDEVKFLSDRNGKVIGKLFDISQKLSGMTDDDVEEIAKN